MAAVGSIYVYAMFTAEGADPAVGSHEIKPGLLQAILRDGFVPVPGLHLVSLGKYLHGENNVVLAADERKGLQTAEQPRIGFHNFRRRGIGEHTETVRRRRKDSGAASRPRW